MLGENKMVKYQKITKWICLFLLHSTLIAYSARTAHPFQRNGAPFRFRLSKAQQVY